MERHNGSKLMLKYLYNSHNFTQSNLLNVKFRISMYIQ